VTELTRLARKRGWRRENFDVWFEHVGEYYDDVLVSFEYNKRTVAAIRALPPGAGYWDPTFKVWRVHPGYAERLAAALIHLGYTVCGRWTSAESQIGTGQSCGEGNSTQLVRPGTGTQKAPHCISAPFRPRRDEQGSPARSRSPQTGLGGHMIDEEQAEVLTTRDLEKRLKIPRKTQIDLRARGGFIPYFPVGHKVLYRRDAVLRWVQEQECKATGGPDGCP
jgi:Helix-turn-helix domain